MLCCSVRSMKERENGNEIGCEMNEGAEKTRRDLGVTMLLGICDQTNG